MAFPCSRGPDHDRFAHLLGSPAGRHAQAWLARLSSTDVVWTAVKQYAKRIDVDHLAPHDLRRTVPASATARAANSNKFSFFSGTRPSNDGTIHRMPAEAQRSGQCPVPNLARQDGAIIRFITEYGYPRGVVVRAEQPRPHLRGQWTRATHDARA